MLEIFEYDFMIRAFQAGIATAVIAPLIGTFLVLKRFSLFADSLAHVALMGVAIGLITSVYPIITAIITCIVAAIVIEKLRQSRKVYEDSALSLFLSGSLAVALVLTSLAKNINANLFDYLFGSVTTLTQTDVYTIVGLAAVIVILIMGLYRELSYIAFDEEAAKVSGLPVKTLNLLLMTLSALAVSLSMRVVGVLLIGALMVIPVLSALQIARSFKQTLLFSICFSILAMFVGLFTSYYLNIIPTGTIVLIAILMFVLAFIVGSWRKGISR